MKHTAYESFEKPDRETWLKVNDFATRSFRDIADGDYINARGAFRAHLVPQALWSSLQAIEKYLKCILLLNRVPARDLRHDVGKALTQVESSVPFTVRLSASSREVIDLVNQFGQYRYFESCYHTFGLELLQLDLAVWELRRYAQVLDYEIRTPKGVVGMLEQNLELLERAESKPHPYRILGGELEKIIDNPKHPARETLLWQNARFGKKHRKTVMYAAHLQASNSPLSLHPEILGDVLKYVYLPSEAIRVYGELARDQAAEKEAVNKRAEATAG